MRYLPELNTSEYAWLRGLERVENRIRDFFKDDDRIKFVAIQPYDSERNVESLVFVGSQRKGSGNRIIAQVPIPEELLQRRNPGAIDEVLPSVRESAGDVIEKLLATEN